ncbi:MAG: hypothetical protein R3336_10285, partial [Phycisphaeraceae bacterium]|nr:hypothetical protein [Phycisphaeraceae bacterium]
ARKKFDLSSLADIEKSSEPTPEETAEDTLSGTDSPTLMDQPLFWIAVAGWIAAFVLLFVGLLVGRLTA